MTVLLSSAFALPPRTAPALEAKTIWQTKGVFVEEVEHDGRPSVAVEYESDFFRDWARIGRAAIGWSGNDSNPIALVVGSGFSDGIIEVDLASTVKTRMLGLARGFAGIAFRVSEDLGSYELVYLRPANGRDDDEVRRSHALQYASHPDFHFDVSRREAPGRYETHADIGLDEWIRLRIEVAGERARVFVNDEPALTVANLQLGPDRKGGIAFWVGMGTRAWFSNLVVTPGREEE